MILNRHFLSSALTFIAVMSASFFFFWGTASAACTVSTIYVYGFPITYTTGDCSTTTASPTASLTATPSFVVFSGGSLSLSWSSTNATSCTGTNFSTGNKKSGSVTMKPTKTTTYTVTCSGGGKTATATKTVNVTTSTTSTSGSGSTSFGNIPNAFGTGTNISFGLTPAPVCIPSLSSNKTTIVSGTSANLTWSGTSNASMHISWQAGSVPPTTIGHLYSPIFDDFIPPTNSTSVSPSSGGSLSVSPTQTTTYIATCTAFGGSFNSTTVRNSNPVTVTVLNPVSGSCSASPTSINTNDSPTWTANPSGGDGTYTYSWSGTNSLSGTSKSVTKTYTSTGTKTASVSITSAGQSKSISCSNSVAVTNPVGGSCSPSPSPASTGEVVTWLANPTGGNGTYAYSWSGTDSLSGSAQSVAKTYTSAGTKNASVSVTSAGQSKSISCSNSLVIPQCSDGKDNDGDGKTDAADPGCKIIDNITNPYNPNDTTESPNPVLPECLDGEDNNNNSLIDYPADPACSSVTDDDEGTAPDPILSLIPEFDLIPATFQAVLSWSVSFVRAGSCSIKGTNPEADVWKLTGASGEVTSSPLVEETIFTLSCTDLNGDSVATGVTIKLVPSFEEI